MAGGLIQLMCYGYADKVLIGDPQITFFKKVYHKYSLFAMQEHEIFSESEVNFGSSTYFKIRNYGDLFFAPYLKIELPDIFKKIRGSTNGVIIGNEIWFLVHEKIKDYYQIYTTTSLK